VQALYDSELTLPPQVSTENGIIHYHDGRNAPSDPSKTKPLWTLQAHDSAVNSFDINPIIPGFLVTGSADKQVKLWNITDSGPSMVVSRDLGVGRVFSTTFAPDQEVGFRLAIAGSEGDVKVWDTSTNAAVRRIFGGRVGAEWKDGEVQERILGVEDSSDESSDDGEEGEEGGDWEDEDEDEDEDMAG
jgi:periodic tryptophan protein 1